LSQETGAGVDLLAELERADAEYLAEDLRPTR